MHETKEILKNQFKKLPEDIQSAILAVDLRSKMQFITKKNNLHIDQAEALENEAVFVLLGLEHPNNLIANIAKHAEVSEEKAEAIAEDLNREIFLKVRESLKKIFEERSEEESSLLGGKEKDRGSFLASSLLGKTGEKTEEEALNREDILREIEDKEHHNLPTVSAPELHLEARPPSELMVKQPDEIMITTNNTHLEARPPSEIAPFQKMKTDDVKIEEPPEMIIIRPKQEQKKPAPPQAETIQAMRGDIFKDKMSGTVSVPKETVEIGDSKLPPTVTQPKAVSKIDPYREQVSL